MMKPKILVMGAVGKTGKEVRLRLLAKDFPVRAFVRVEDLRSPLVVGRAQSASLARGARSQQLHQAGAEILASLITEELTLFPVGFTQRGDLKL